MLNYRELTRGESWPERHVTDIIVERLDQNEFWRHDFMEAGTDLAPHWPPLVQFVVEPRAATS